MAIFGSKKKTEPKAVVAKTTEAKLDIKNRAGAIVGPRITEKATAMAETGTYVFEIRKDANKKSVAQAVFEIYKVKPVAVRIGRSPAKNVFIRGRAGVKQGVKKAYVVLKKGDKIEFV